MSFLTLNLTVGIHISTVSRIMRFAPCTSIPMFQIITVSSGQVDVVRCVKSMWMQN